MPSPSTLCLAKGTTDLLLAYALLFQPSIVFDSPITAAVSRFTGLPLLTDAAPIETFTLGALVLGAAISGIRSGRANSADAHQSVAAMNGTFALTLIGAHILAPLSLASSASLLLALQDALWSFAIIYTGGFSPLETFGLTSPNPSTLSHSSLSSSSFAPKPISAAIGDLSTTAGQAAGEIKKQAEIHGVTLGNVLGERSMEEKNARGTTVRKDVQGTAERIPVN